MGLLSLKTKLLLLRRKTMQKNHTKRMCLRQIYKDMKQKGELHLLIREMKLHDHTLFFQYFRMSPTQYEDLLKQISTVVIQKQSEKREPIGPSERPALRYIFTGDSQKTIASSFRISPTSIGRIIYENTDAIWNVLASKYLVCPNSENEWLKIASEFEKKWQFNHCLGEYAPLF